jgi:hypothetical protein
MHAGGNLNEPRSPLRRRIDACLNSSEQSGASTIPEQVCVTNVGLQYVHRLVPRHIPHLEHRSAAARRAGQEAFLSGLLPRDAAVRR